METIDQVPEILEEKELLAHTIKNYMHRIRSCLPSGSASLSIRRPARR